MRIDNLLRKKWLLHSAGWIIFFLVPLMLAPPGDFTKSLENPQYLISLVLRNGVLMVLFYINLLYLTPVVLRQSGAIVFVIVLLLLVVATSLVNWQIHHAFADPFMPGMNSDPPPPPPDEMPGMRSRPIMFASPLFSSVLISTIVAIFSTSLFLWDDWVRAKEEAQTRDLEKMTAELAALKLQISPHFLFNTLNNIRWLVRNGDSNAEHSLVQLSQLLRYILYEATAEKVLLSSEIDHLRDYVELQKIRLQDQEAFRFEVAGQPAARTVVPLLMLPLAENFFKHGDFTVKGNLLRIDVRDNLLVMTSENHVARLTSSVEAGSHGIGLANLRKRLGVYYPKKHQLIVTSENQLFIVRLEILLT